MFGRKKKEPQQVVNNNVESAPQEESQEYYEDETLENNQNAYYYQNNVEPLNASELVQNVYEDPNAIVIIPGRDGVPYNITQKGIEDLTRLERLRKNGVISDQTYYNMKQKICNTFVS